MARSVLNQAQQTKTLTRRLAANPKGIDIMQKLTRLAAAALLAAGAFAGGQASAATICSNCLYTAAGATYLGVHDANNFDGSGFRRENLLGPVPFVQDTWVFDLQPVGGTAQINANFIPLVPNSLPGFTVNLFAVSSYNCPNGIGNSSGTTGFCPSVTTVGPSLATSIPAVGGANVFPVGLSAGSYAFVITYSVAALGGGQTAEYSGQLRMAPIPEPGSLALVGLALVGAAVGVRRARKA